MTISYRWLCEYLSEKPGPEKMSEILTSIGLEVESLVKYQEIRGGLEGLIVGEVLTCEKHPDADKLKLTTVFTGNQTLKIVCGAANVAAGQKVVLAPAGTTIYPTLGEPITLKKTKIRGAESEGMICAEDEIGLGNNHDGIMVLPAETPAGIKVADIFKPYEDDIFEIGLTPNRMDAMSHLGVARDVCAWLSYHQKKDIKPVLPYTSNNMEALKPSSIQVLVENASDCKRYSGIHISGITVGPSPVWMQQKLKSIGVKPINNIVDITNFILHETGQPLHAFDADKISGKKIIVKNLPEGTLFTTLDDKERKLHAGDLMICDAEGPLCIAGVYGGKNSGVSNDTKNIFLESAWFSPVSVRKTSLQHDLRTDAASRFEKGTDISQTVNVLTRAASLITELADGGADEQTIDVYPEPLARTTVSLHYDYLKKLSGKDYPADDVRQVLKSLHFSIVEDHDAGMTVEVPYSKTDISIPADIVEEIMRIDGLDQVAIPTSIRITPSVEKDADNINRREKLAQYLTGAGFYEIFTNSITNSAFYPEEVLKSSVKMINSLSAELDMLRPQMIQGGLQAISHNLNRKNEDLLFFEFGKTYSVDEHGKYLESNHLSLYTTGRVHETHWKIKPAEADYHFLKGIVERLMQVSGLKKYTLEDAEVGLMSPCTKIMYAKKMIGSFGQVEQKTLKSFDIKVPVYHADIDLDSLLPLSVNNLRYKEITKYPSVSRDLSLVVDKNVSYSALEKIALGTNINQLKSVSLFDIFESDKLGAGKKSMALSFVFMDETKTLTDKEIDIFMQKIISSCEKNVQAEIRK